MSASEDYIVENARQIQAAIDELDVGTLFELKELFADVHWIELGPLRRSVTRKFSERINGDGELVPRFHRVAVRGVRQNGRERMFERIE